MPTSASPGGEPALDFSGSTEPIEEQDVEASAARENPVGGVLSEVQNVMMMEASDVVEQLSAIMREKLQRCEKALLQAPLIAVLLSADAPAFTAAGEGRVCRAARLEVEAELNYFDKPCKLWVVGPREWPRKNGKRPTVGDHVRIVETTNTREHFQEGIGRISKIVLDEHGEQPYKVDGSDARLYEADVHLGEEFPAVVLIELDRLIRKALEGHFAHDGPCIWPIQSFEHSLAIMQLEEILLALDRHASRCHRLLYALRILPRHQDFIGVIRAHFGPDAAYNYRWSCFWVQHLWVLGFICVVILCAGVASPSGNEGDGAPGRVPWEISKSVLCLWVMVLPLSSWLQIPKAVSNPFEFQNVFCRFMRKATQGSGEPGELALTPPEISLPALPHQQGTCESLGQAVAVAEVFCEDTPVPNPDYLANETWQEFGKRCAKAFLCILCIWIFFAFLRNLFMFFVWLIMYIIYLWGECDTIDPPCSSPNGPDEKYAPRGTLVEIGCDVALAILFEAFIPISMMLGGWLAHLANYKTMEDRNFTSQAVTLVLAALERVSFLVILGMFFAPQWEAPDQQIMSDRFNMDDCFEAKYTRALLLGDNAAFACIRSRLPYEDRLLVFTKLVKGPFMVAPFVSIIVKILIPLLAERLDFWSRRFACFGCCEGFADGFCRILSFIFVFDGSAVGGLRFVIKGWPFRDLRVVNRSTWDESEQPLAEAVETLDVCDPVLMAARPFCCSRRLPKQQLFEIDSSGRRRRLKPRGPAAPPSGGEGSLPSSPSSHQTSDLCSPTGSGGNGGGGAMVGARLSLETRLQLVLQQGARKPFEPQCELLTTKMNVIFVAFFVAVMPYGTIGALVTLGAKLLELKCGLSKMVFVRRRVLAGTDRAMRRTQRNFSIALAGAIPAWSALLSLITFNETLYKWGQGPSGSRSLGIWSFEPKDVIVRSVLIWLSLAAIFFLTSNNHGQHWTRNWKRWSLIVVGLPILWLAINPRSTVGSSPGA